MVENLKKILADIQSSHGEVTVFALLKMDEFIDKWTIIFYAPWSIYEDRDKTFNIIKESLLKFLTPEEKSEVTRISVYSKEEHLIEELLKYKAGAKIEGEKLNGNMVHSAIIIKSGDSVIE